MWIIIQELWTMYSRGAIHFDYDNDGDQDIFVVNQTPIYDMTYRGIIESFTK